MENEGVAQEKFPLDLRRKVVADFVRDISEGRLFLSIDHKKWGQQDIDLIGNTTGRLIRDLSEYVSGAVAGEEFEFLEKQIFFSISVLRTYDSLKTNINESRVEDELRKLQYKVDSLTERMEELLRAKKLETPLEREKENLAPAPPSIRTVKKAAEILEEKKSLPDEDEGLF
ncbi:MAG: hypothetical protein ACHQ1H_01410 [Nitrososphaerales archaeon]